MTSRKLMLQEMAESGFTHAIRITYLDFANMQPPGLTKAIPIFPESGVFRAGQTFRQPAGCRVHTGFGSGGAISLVTVQLGDINDPDRIMLATNIHASSPNAYFVGLNSIATMPFGYSTTGTVEALFTATGGNLDTLTQGDVEIFFSTFNFNDIDSRTGPS